MTDAIPDDIMREARNLYNTLWGVGAVISENEQNENVAIIAHALTARDKRAAEIARMEASLCRDRSNATDDLNKCNFWGGCCDTAGIIAQAILTYEASNAK